MTCYKGTALFCYTQRKNKVPWFLKQRTYGLALNIKETSKDHFKSSPWKTRWRIWKTFQESHWRTCTKELLKRIIKDFVINNERQAILEDINSHNIKLDEAKYKFFKSIYKSQAMKNVFWQDRHYFIYQLLTTKKNSSSNRGIFTNFRDLRGKQV